VYYVFDLLVLAGKDVTKEPLDKRRALLEKHVLPLLDEPIRYSQELPASLADLIEAVREHGFEGLVAKKRSSRYESVKRSGAWQKMRVNRSQDFVIGGYTTGGNPFDALVFGYYQKGRLMYAVRTQVGFTPALRFALMKLFKDLEIKECPFANLPESKEGRWGQGLTVAKMKTAGSSSRCWLGSSHFLEWTADESSPAFSIREVARGPEGE
jgi:bifunctional non-homologous end joining protein LigD